MSRALVTDLVQIEIVAREKEAENLAFRRYLHEHHRPEHEFSGVAAVIEAQVDCTQCANCCRQTEVEISESEAGAIARHLNIPLEATLRLYSVPNPRTGVRALAQRDGACVFLDRNLCMVYEARPRACRDFPHTHPRGVTLGSRWSSICSHSSLCPILFNALEEYKHRTGFHFHQR